MKLTKAQERTKTSLSAFIQAGHPVALAVEPLRSQAVERAEKNAREIVDRVRQELEAAGYDLHVCAPYPAHNLHGARYYSALSTYKLFQSLCEWRRSSGSPYEPCFADVKAEKVAAFVKESKASAALQYDAFIVKLCEKIGACKAASITGSHVWGFSLLTVEKATGRETWKTQQICNVSKLGKLFNQWPSRKVKS